MIAGVAWNPALQLAAYQSFGPAEVPLSDAEYKLICKPDPCRQAILIEHLSGANALRLGHADSLVSLANAEFNPIFPYILTAAEYPFYVQNALYAKGGVDTIIRVTEYRIKFNMGKV